MRDGLALWQGSPLPDLAGLPGEQLADRFTMLREQARELHGSLLTELGRHAEAISELSALLSDAPLRESAAVLLIRSLYADGRPAEALDTHRAMVARLADQGLDATPTLRELEAAILRHSTTSSA